MKTRRQSKCKTRSSDPPKSATSAQDPTTTIYDSSQSQQSQKSRSQKAVNSTHVSSSIASDNIRGKGSESKSDICMMSSSIGSRSTLSDVSVEINKTSKSTPAGNKKMVTFSKDLVSDAPSQSRLVPPQKSILKSSAQKCGQSNGEKDNALLWQWSSDPKKNPNFPGNSDFWIRGTVIQRPPGSVDLAQLAQGCLSVLRDENFDKRFEVYATLNNIYKTNSGENLYKIFSSSKSSILSPRRQNTFPKTISESIIPDLLSMAKKDVINHEILMTDTTGEKENIVPSKINPFSIRVVTQALKLVTHVFADQNLNSLVNLEELKWFYVHACSTLTDVNTSKSLIASYMGLIKDFNFTLKRKRLLFDCSDLPEKLLYALISMKSFPSPSIVTERLIVFKNLVLNFPNMMAKNFRHWYGLILFNICSLTSPAYFKCLSVGSSVLFEISKVFLENKSCMSHVNSFLESSLPKGMRSFFVDDSIFDEEFSERNLGIEYIVSSLNIMIEGCQFGPAMEIWMAITILNKAGPRGLETWPHVTEWLKVQKNCFNADDESAKVIALSSWRAVSYRLCINDLSNLSKFFEHQQSSGKQTAQILSGSFKNKTRLLLHSLLNVTAIENKPDIIRVLHDMFLTILHNLINPISSKPATKYMQIYWDKVFQPVFSGFYFKESSNQQMHSLGLQLLTKLLKVNVSNTPEKSFNESRCLANDSISLCEILPVPLRWFHSYFDRISQSILLVFQSRKLQPDQKMSFLNDILESVKVITKKELKTSPATHCIINSLPSLLEELLRDNNISFQMIQELLMNLHGTFEPLALLSHSSSDDGLKSESIYFVIIRSCALHFSDSQLKKVISMIGSALTPRKIMELILCLSRLQIEKKDEAIEDVLLSLIDSTNIDINPDFQLYGELLCNLRDPNEALIKSIIQAAINESSNGDLSRTFSHLKIESWPLERFMYFISLVHEAPLDSLNNFTNELICRKLEDQKTFLTLSKFLTQNKFNFEVLAVRSNMLQKFNCMEGFLRFDFSSMWRNYLCSLSKDEDFQSLDSLLAETYLSTDIDVKPYICNKWDSLPILKKLWLEHNTELYFDRALSSFQNNGLNADIKVKVGKEFNKISSSPLKREGKSNPAHKRSCPSDPNENDMKRNTDLLQVGKKNSCNFDLYNFTDIVTKRLSGNEPAQYDQRASQSSATMSTDHKMNSTTDKSSQSSREKRAIEGSIEEGAPKRQKFQETNSSSLESVSDCQARGSFEINGLSTPDDSMDETLTKGSLKNSQHIVSGDELEVALNSAHEFKSQPSSPIFDQNNFMEVSTVNDDFKRHADNQTRHNSSRRGVSLPAHLNGQVSNYMPRAVENQIQKHDGCPIQVMGGTVDKASSEAFDEKNQSTTESTLDKTDSQTSAYQILTNTLESIEHSDISNMSSQERFNIETRFMQFILQMRNLPLPES